MFFSLFSQLYFLNFVFSTFEVKTPSLLAPPKLNPIFAQTPCESPPNPLRNPNSKSTYSESSSSPAFESTASFLSFFANSKHSIEVRIAQCRLSHISYVTQLKPQLGSISASISNLEKLITENSYFLPCYKVLWKKKFSFKNKVVKKDPVTDSKMEEEKPKEAEKMGFAVLDSPGFRNKIGEVLVRKFEGSKVGEFMILNLDSCEVRLMGCVGALFIHRLRNCRIYGGHVMGFILTDGAKGCVFLPWSPSPVISSSIFHFFHALETPSFLRWVCRPTLNW
ncbi:hypothetical protein UlMin_012235 [Ulmus minor]